MQYIYIYIHTVHTYRYIHICSICMYVYIYVILSYGNILDASPSWHIKLSMMRFASPAMVTSHVTGLVEPSMAFPHH